MKLSILDENVSIVMNTFLIIANIINLIYNIPQMIKTYHTKSTRDFSVWFIFLRIIGNSIWIVYAIEIDSLQMLINNVTTVSASIFIGYYKTIEMYGDYREKKHKEKYDDEGYDGEGYYYKEYDGHALIQAGELESDIEMHMLQA
jgi:MtN3 and saliva related transmembrane protein